MFSKVLALALASVAVSAVEWHDLQYYTAQGQQFIGLSVDMLVPPNPPAGGYFLWPGLSPSDNTGVFQPVLDGRSGGWWIGWGWCCSNPSLGWGGGFGVSPGDTVHIEANYNETTTNWDTLLTVPEKNLTATGEWPLGYKAFNMLSFAIELYDVPWSFGPLKFSNINLSVNGTGDTSFCTAPPYNLYGSTNYTQGQPIAQPYSDSCTCNIPELILENPQ